MSPFPALDPIPLPAPVWVFKTLHILFLGLHFTAVISRLTDQNRILAQRMALLEESVRRAASPGERPR